MGSTIDLTAADGHKLSAYVAGPSDAKKGLVVIQEIFGINHHMRNVVDRFAGQGYAVCAPALFDRVELGYGQDDMAAGRGYRMKLTEAGVIADVHAAAKHLAGKQLGIVGYCYGGTVSWWGATRTHSFAAACCWYGGGIAATRNETPNCVVQMHFGDKDQSIPMTDVEAIRAAQPRVEIYVYPGAGHGFGCDERDSFSKPDADLAQQRTLAFFTKHLG